MTTGEELSNFRRDNDSLYVLPLEIVKIETPGLRRARLRKNFKLEPVIELFSSPESGSGQVEIQNLNQMFGWSTSPPHPDGELIRSLARLSSYDVYSLRIKLRELGIQLSSMAALQLSDEKKNELKGYMTKFTLPLIKEVYGHTDIDIESVDDIIKLFADPDIESAIAKLKKLAAKLDIGLQDIPKFLEDYSDIYMSLAYFQQHLDEITPHVTDVISEMRKLHENWELRQNPNLMRTCEELEGTLNNLTSHVSGRFESFNLNTQNMWDNLTAERFRKIETLIKSHHTTIGGVLYGLGVKMSAWKEKFPKADVGSPASRADMIMSSIRPGMEKVLQMVADAPDMADALSAVGSANAA